MNIDLCPARVDERPILCHLLELYQYDFSLDKEHWHGPVQATNSISQGSE